MRGRSVHIYLPDETKNDFRVATIPNWTGSIITARESQLELLLAREELSRPGCYIMMSGDRYDGDATAYIGETGDLRQRLKANDHKDRGWERIAFISTTDTSFSKGHYLRIEQELIKHATKSGGISLQNGTSGFPSGARLGEAQESDAVYFFDNVKGLLPVLGFDIFYEKAAGENKYGEPSNPEFILTLKNESLGSAVLRNGNLVVLKGSKVAFDKEYQINQYSKLRKALLDDGVISRDEESPRGVFTRDYEFTAPSAASATLIGRNDNGRNSWKLKSDTSISLGDWQAEEAAKIEKLMEELI